MSDGLWEAADVTKPLQCLWFPCWTVHLTVSHMSLLAGTDAAPVASTGAQQRGRKGEKSHGSGKAKGVARGFFVGFFSQPELGFTQSLPFIKIGMARIVSMQ